MNAPRRGTRRPDQDAILTESLRAGVILVAASALCYAVALFLFFDVATYQIFIVSMAPILTAAWVLGFRGALAVAGVVTTSHVLLIVASGGSVHQWIASGGGLGTIASFVAGGLVGQNRSLRTRLVREREILTQTQDVTIFALAYEAELRDHATGKHLERTSEYVKILATELARHPNYYQYLTESYVADLVRAAPLHDIGKVGIPDAILLKPAKLTAAEFSVMQEHCELGVQVLNKADERLRFQSFLKIGSPPNL